MMRVRLFGLTIASDLPLPGLVPAAEQAPVDVWIRRGRLGEEADLVVSEAGSFAVRNGREIIVDAPDDMPERNVRLYLLGSAMGLLLHQRGLFPLHANAVAVGGRAIAVAGASGAGKSTLAAWFSRQGLDLIGDDVVALKPTPEGMIAMPGPPRVRLWRQSLDRFGLGSEGLEQSYVDAGYDKWDLPVEASRLTSQERRLARSTCLATGRKWRSAGWAGRQRPRLCSITPIGVNMSSGWMAPPGTGGRSRCWPARYRYSASRVRGTLPS